MTADQVEIFRAISIRGALQLWTKGVQVNRTWTLTRMLRVAKRITGEDFPRSRAGAAAAAKALTNWIEAQR
jgi:hypothetical protein